MKKIQNTMFIIVAIAVSIVCLFNSHYLYKENKKIAALLKHREHLIEQLNFNLRVIETIRRGQHDLSAYGINHQKDTIILFYFSDLSCMNCVTFELAENIKDREISVVADITLDREYETLSRTYYQYAFRRDTSIHNTIEQPFYVVLVKKSVRELYAPDIQNGSLTKAFLERYGF
ncbi:hypothetical protein [Gaoshiqia sp. Z1-71]|uniref:hypothetical protein n=1 Tax=Gaoshiqia hydrogeniformans TaxID=3290090 RepID=UPI003BF912B5